MSIEQWLGDNYERTFDKPTTWGGKLKKLWSCFVIGCFFLLLMCFAPIAWIWKKITGV